jgi:hypothetical protein
MLHANRSAVSADAAFFQALANVILGNNRSVFLEDGVTAGVIAVIVGVDNEAHRLVGDAFERRLNLIGQGSVLIIHDDDSILPDRGADIAGIVSFQHVDAAGDLGHFHLDFAEVLILGNCEYAYEHDRKTNLAHLPSSPIQKTWLATDSHGFLLISLRESCARIPCTPERHESKL